MKKKYEVRPTSGWMFAFMTLAVFITASLFPSKSFAAKPDFSGTWTLNEEKSEIGEMRFRPSATLNVKQDKTNLTVSRTRTGRDGQEVTRESVYNLDGSETTTEGERRKTVSTAKWSEDGKSLVIHSTSSWTREGETFEFTNVETWMLGEKGKSLNIETSSSSSRGEFSYKLVYDLSKN